MEFKKGEVLRAEDYGALFCNRCKRNVKVLYQWGNEYLCIDCINKIEYEGDVEYGDENF